MKTYYINEILKIEAEINENKSPYEIALIKQTFVVWYFLVEGNNEFEKDYLQQILDRDVILMNKLYPKKPDLLFLLGWMIKISPWYFNLVDDEISEKYLNLAYKYKPHNLLFKWALSDESQMGKIAINQLEYLVLKNLDSYCINYVPIKEYFKHVVGRK